MRTALQEVLEAEMTEALGAEKGEGAAVRQAYRSGYYGRTLITQVGKLELRVPQDRTGRFSTELFERNQRSERALVAALAEMYVQGVSTRKVKAITEELGDAAPHRVALNNYLRHGSSPRPGDLTRVTLRIAPGTRRPNLIGDATTQYLEEIDADQNAGEKRQGECVAEAATAVGGARRVVG